MLNRDLKCVVLATNSLFLPRKPAEEPEEPGGANNEDVGEDSVSTADVKDPTEYEQVFKPNTNLGMFEAFELLFSTSSCAANN